MTFQSILKKAAAQTIAGTATLAFFGAICLAAAGSSYAASLNLDLSSPQALPAESGPPGPPPAIVGTPKPASARSAKSVVPARALSAAPPPSAVDTANTLNKLLAPRASNPDVPLPQEDLAEAPPAYTPLDGPQIYGRGEQGGGVLGLKIPIPVDHGAFGPHTKSSSGTSP